MSFIKDDRHALRRPVWPHSAIEAGSTSHLMAGRKAGFGLRVAILVAMLSVPLFAASPARAASSEFYGIAQGTLDLQDYEGMQAARCTRSASCSGGGRSSRPRARSTGPTGQFRRPARLARNPAAAVPLGIADLGRKRRPRPAAAQQRRRPDGVEGLPDAGRVALRPRRQLLGRRPYHQKYGASATAAAGPVVADLERAQPEEVLHPGASVAQSAQKYVNLLKISHDAIKAKDSHALIVLAGMPGFGDSKAWVFLDNIYDVAGIKDYFDVAALHPYARDINEFRSELNLFRTSIVEPRRRGDADVAHRVGLGLGPSGPIRPQRGAHRPADDAEQLRQAGPPAAHGLEHPADVSGSCGAIRNRGPSTRTCAASAAPPGC